MPASNAQAGLLADRFNTLFYDEECHTVVVLDRRRYPFEKHYVTCRTLDDVMYAIQAMIVQGGPPLAYVAGLGLALVAHHERSRPASAQLRALREAAERLRALRPTADDVHHLLRHALERAQAALEQGASAHAHILAYVNEEIERGNRVAEACGRHAAALLADGDSLLTHCYPGAAFNYMLFYARRDGKQLKVIACETRPYLQGARLTASQAVEIGVPVQVITDGMAAFVMAQGMVTTYVTAADRIALDGAIANKVGTLEHAIAARHYTIPFYVLGYDGPDPETPTGADIPIEMRDPTEVLRCGGMSTAVEGVQALYPAFDITPPELITAIVTERGVFRPSEMWTYWPNHHGATDAH
ncbi:MAG: s-methyl-5-thioribose-1-phosphate isomerase [Ardenticatenia bacterium]|nr:s-methyl-5-thioribose-1-phosphate isomerase [Ardenticatenia bacterium]